MQIPTFWKVDTGGLRTTVIRILTYLEKLEKIRKITLLSKWITQLTSMMLDSFRILAIPLCQYVVYTVEMIILVNEVQSWWILLKIIEIMMDASSIILLMLYSSNGHP